MLAILFFGMMVLKARRGVVTIILFKTNKLSEAPLFLCGDK